MGMSKVTQLRCGTAPETLPDSFNKNEVVS